jgi:hypothetical protein
MAYEPKEGAGAIFPNNKQKDNQPDYRGDFMLNGEMYEVAGWKKQTQAGKTFLSIRVQAKRERQGGYNANNPPPDEGRGHGASPAQALKDRARANAPADPPYSAEGVDPDSIPF